MRSTTDLLPGPIRLPHRDPGGSTHLTLPPQSDLPPVLVIGRHPEQRTSTMNTAGKLMLLVTTYFGLKPDLPRADQIQFKDRVPECLGGFEKIRHDIDHRPDVVAS